MIERISTANAPPPGGHYAQATAWRDLVFVSGQLPIVTSRERPVGFDAEARQALANLCAILAASGASPASVVKLTVYIAGIEHWPAFDAICAEIFGETRPARSVVPVPELHHGYLVEIDAIAVRGG